MRRTWQSLTLRGRTFLLVGVVGSAVALCWGQRPLAWLAALFAVAPLAALLMLWRTRLQLQVERRVTPVRTPLGERLSAELVLTQERALPVGLLRFEDAVPAQLGRRPRFVAHRVAGTWQRTVSYPLLALARGRHRVGPLVVHAVDPFGLAALSTSVGERTEVLVLPHVHPLDVTPDTGGAGTSGDTAPERIGRTGQDDVLVREYLPGDDVRRVHWRSSARWDQLMVRREEQAWEPSVTVLLDNRATHHTGTGRTSSLEWAVSAAASVCDHFARSGYRVALVDADGLVLTGGTQDAETTRETCLLALADALPSAETSLDRALGATHASREGAVVVAVLSRPDADDLPVLTGVRRAHSGGLAIVLDPDRRPEEVPASSRPTGNDAPGAPSAALAQVLTGLHEHHWRVAAATTATPVPDAWRRLTRERVA